jgi:hypothetical protein
MKRRTTAKRIVSLTFVILLMGAGFMFAETTTDTGAQPGGSRSFLRSLPPLHIRP